jgi:hypothetical protein
MVKPPLRLPGAETASSAGTSGHPAASNPQDRQSILGVNK